MKKRDLIKLQGALISIEGRQFSVKFSYFVAKTKVMIKNEFAALDEVRKPSEKFMEYDTKRAQLAHDLADRLPDGQPKIENNNFIIVEKVDEFKTKLDELKEQYKAAIKKHEKNQKEFDDLLNEDIVLDTPKINLKDIPPAIEPSVLEVLISADLIEEDDEE